MKVLYLLPILPPKLPKAEALLQEITLLRAAFSGDIIYLNPNASLPIPAPRLCFGLHLLPLLWRQERAYDLIHFYNPDPFPYPVLRCLKKPVVYSLLGGVGKQPHWTRFFRSLAAVTVSDEQSQQNLQAWGLSNVHLVRPGIETERFTYQPRPLGEAIHLLMASAPWTLDQFRSKGVEALLDAARAEPRLHLTFLWRGVLSEEMQQRIAQADLGQRVVLIDQQMDVNSLLAQVHAAIVVAETATIVKAWPHSLLDSLAAGKPVLVSRTIPMAAYVERTGCGVVVESVTPQAVLAGLQKLLANYAHYQQAALAVGQDFGAEALIKSVQAVYTKVI